jgi:hypothetical protein
MGKTRGAPAEVPRTISLDEELEARLSFTGDRGRNPTVIVVPGLGVRRGEQERKASRALRRAASLGTHLNIATFLYPSHRAEPLSGFKQDPGALAKVVEALRTRGVSQDRMGFFAICYGVNVLCRYREENDGGRFALLIEPLLGYKGLRFPVRILARAGLTLLDRLGLAWAWGRKYRVDPGSFHQVLTPDVRLDQLAMPFSTVSNRRHGMIFRQRHLRLHLKGPHVRHEVIDGKSFSRDSVQRYYRVVREALQDWVFRHTGEGEGTGHPPATSSLPIP